MHRTQLDYATTHTHTLKCRGALSALQLMVIFPNSDNPPVVMGRTDVGRVVMMVAIYIVRAVSLCNIDRILINAAAKLKHIHTFIYVYY